MSPGMPRELQEICADWSRAMAPIKDTKLRRQFMKAHFPKLLKKTSLIADLIERIARGRTYPDLRRTDAFENEILLYLNPRRIFSLRMFLFGPEEFTPVHDHNAWGITSAVVNRLTVVRYDRDDDGSLKGYARLHETGRAALGPGQIETTRPLDAGIHRIGNAGREPMAMLSIYGSPVRRRYVNGYDVMTNRVFKMYSPRVKKKLLGKSILPFIDPAGPM